MFGRKGQKPVRKHRRLFHSEMLEACTMMSASPFSPTVPVTAVEASGVAPLQVNALNPTWYQPEDIKAAYGYGNPSPLGLTGAGQTVAIVEAYDVYDEYLIKSDGNTASYGDYLTNLNGDLSAFDQQFHLNDSIEINSTLGSTVPWAGDGSPSNPPLSFDNIGTGGSVWTSEWGREAAMDVEWVHAIAPDAQIDVIEAQSGSLQDLLAAVDVARNLPGVSVVSISWSFPESQSETQDDAHFLTPAGHTPVTFIASSGDAGGYNSDPNSGARYPASSPNVLAVGGTNLKDDPQSVPQYSETAWSNTLVDPTQNIWQGSGGGISSFESQPSYMTSFMPSIKRTTPDVSFDADPATPVATYHSEEGGWLFGAGTSLGAPAWAGTIALADQGRVTNHEATLGHLNQDIYSLDSNDFNDITQGGNGFNTEPGYDMVTGRGTPKAGALLPDLIAADEPIVGIGRPPVGYDPTASQTEKPNQAGGPTSNVATLPAAVSSTSFTVSWSGANGADGSSIASYDIFVSDNGGPFSAFQKGTTATSATFTGINGHTYGFFSVATDGVGNRQPTPAAAQTTTEVVLGKDANGRYVVAVYSEVLDRAPDAGGLDFWTDLLDSGTAVSSVAESIAHSAEYYASFVIKPAFLSLLGRAGDDAEMSYWTKSMQNGLTNQQLEAGLVASDEFFSSAGGTDAAWIDAIYTRLLDRTADASGETYWNNQLSAGASRGEVALRIANSAENDAQLINDDYFHYLGRGADPDGSTYWLGQFAGGRTNEDVIAGFTGSAEYYKEHTN
jgi:hypothetical protein